MIKAARVLRRIAKGRQKLGVLTLHDRCVSQFPNVDARLLAISMAMLFARKS